MIETGIRISLLRVGLALAGLAVLVILGWNALTRSHLPALLSGWCVPAVVFLHLVQQAGCGCAWRRLIGGARPSRWAFFRMRWVRASIAALLPVSGVGAALVAVRLAMRAGLTLDIASGSLTVDATAEMISQIIFTALGFGLLLVAVPESRIALWAAATLSVAVLAAAAFVLAQRVGGMRVIEVGLSKLARRWPRFFPLTEARLHNALMGLYQNPKALCAAGFLHFCCWMLGAGEIFVILLAFGNPVSPAKCVIIESLSVLGRSVGFFVPGAIGVQEVSLVLVGSLVGLSVETAIVIAVVKRLRDIAVGVPGLIVWQLTEASRFVISCFVDVCTSRTLSRTPSSSEDRRGRTRGSLVE